MNLPNGAHAVVGADKVRDYLLDVTHPDGFGKAAFFTAMGFQREAWEELANALRQIAWDSAVTKSMTSMHGQKYIVDGIIPTPMGQNVIVRTIWIVDKGEDRPRFVTAYPQEREP
ncbi:MAG: hypothetical protein R3B74_01655 [Nitrospirales bacterium]|nr:hypothetical protein [Nitrospirales bacterium]